VLVLLLLGANNDMIDRLPKKEDSMSDLKQELSHVYWIGGSPCAGKTTLARRLVDEYHFTYYKCDDCYDDHMSRSMPDQHPAMYKIRDLTWDQVWSSRFCSIPVGLQILEVIKVYQEQFQLILEDLLDRPKTSNILVEGAVLLPELVAPLLQNRHQAIWFLPAAEFQIKHYAKREWIHSILDQYDDPQSAFSNWMNRDIGFAQEVIEKAGQLGLVTIQIDERLSIDQQYEMLTRQFRLR
jgi:2-phosphoglycerate kinase